MLAAENADEVCQVCDTNIVEALLSYISWVVAAVAARPTFADRSEYASDPWSHHERYSPVLHHNATPPLILRLSRVGGRPHA